jgi:uncharacterized protein YfaS (alpha-2-macroglobulin family)
MKTLKNLFSLFFVLIAVAIFSACNQKPASYSSASITPELSAYIYAYTSGVISKANPIKVRFTQPVASTIEKGLEQLFKITPAVSGEVTWFDEQTLQFTPTTTLKSNTVYNATINLKPLFANLPANADKFEFNFKTREQFVNVAVDGLIAADFSDLSKQKITGVIHTSDVVNAEELEAIFAARQGNAKLPVEWSHSDNQMTHTFVVNNVERGKERKTVDLQWDGKSIEANQKASLPFTVPSLDEFTVMDVKKSETEEQYIAINFSDPIQADQDLNGLINISGYNERLRFLVDGNQVRIYPPSRVLGSKTINVLQGIRNINGKPMEKATIWQLQFDDVKPKVKLVGNGVILPNSKGLIFPFDAVNLNAVEVEIFKIFNNNILQFLQVNDLDGNYDLKRVGRIIMRKKIDLTQLTSQSNAAWTRYAIDLKPLIDDDPKAIYQVRIGFRPEYATYFCGTSANSDTDLTQLESYEEDNYNDEEGFFGDWYGINGYYEGYRWDHREDPCQPAYYNYEKFVRRNVISSNLGLIAKGGKDGSMSVFVTDLLNTNPVGGVNLDFYDYQQQKIATTTTNSSGIANLMLPNEAFAVIATHNNQVGYLKLEDGNSLSLSRFDVSGAVTQKGIKGFIYGDRGVWRPGDSLYLNFILEAREKDLPKNYPITFELYDSRGQLQQKRTITQSVGNIYALHTATAPDAPTGNWTATVKVGGAKFDKTLKIETVKPNRLKIALDFGKQELSYADIPLKATVNVDWLYGAPAQNLNTIIEMNLRATPTKFANLNSYVFDDPTRVINAEPKVVFDGKTDVQGRASFVTNMATNEVAAGKLIATFKSRAFEAGGDFSTSTMSVPYSPYASYAGIQIPQNKEGEKRLDIGKDGILNFIAVNEKGQPVGNKNLSIGLYRVEWRWWWDRSDDYISQYSSSEHYAALQVSKAVTDAKGLAKLSFKVEEWGRYLVRVCDTQSGHCAGDFFYAGYPWYDEDGGNRSEAAMLTFATNKQQYNVGETVTLEVPATGNGKALITIENGTKVIQSFWENTKAGKNTISFKTTEDMSPNVYAHVSLVQPHGQTENDLPIRMYGVTNIAVENPATRLTPVVNMPKELKPEKSFVIEVSEKNKQPMAYTIALVDEGLLDLTNFKTPQPHDVFYAREALGVKTWDVYDYVLGAFGGEMQRILSIGGDIEIDASKAKEQANRFKPVVKHLGPFYLEKGKTAKHEIVMPNYVGSVKTMVVAAGANGAYGNAEVATPVRNPLMVLATLPRVLGLKEQIQLPVSIITTDAKVRDVKLTVEESSGLMKWNGSKSKTITFAKVGEQMVTFDLEVLENQGVAKFKISATGNGESASQTIEIDVRNPNPYVTDVQEIVVESNKAHTFQFTPIGSKGTNRITLEVSNIPPINLDKHMSYLIQYPHGCVEQIVSGAFPQLFLANLTELSKTQQEATQRNVVATLDKLKQYQTNEGGFGYWQGSEDAGAWVSNYVGHFMLEAQKKGYAVPQGMLNKWKQFQKNRANNWTKPAITSPYGTEDLDQAYRLFTLALAGDAAQGAMNKMRTTNNLSIQAKWRLAAAYALTGKSEVAQALIQNVGTNIAPYQELAFTYGSDLRDQAMIVESMLLMNNKTAAAPIIKSISEELSGSEWISTQTMAYALLAVSQFVGNDASSKSFKFAYQLGNAQAVNAGASAPIVQVDVPANGGQSQTVRFENKHTGILYARLIMTGQPVIGDQTTAAQHLTMQVRYTNKQGNPIDITSLAQGTDFVAEVSITNPGTKGINYNEMALSQTFPSGWEIINSRLDGLSGITSSVPEYQDIRDDRVYTYFDIRKGTTQVYRIQLNAAYQGRFYLPSISCEAMYDNSITARTLGQWVQVVARENM